MRRPRLSYLICSTPRSGSTLLSEAMQNTGIAGRPEEYYQHRRKTGLPRRPREYFEGVESDEILDILGNESRDDENADYDPRRFERYADYVAWTIEQGTTPNGVFGAKVMWGYFAGFVDRLRELPGRADLATTDLLPSVFPNLRYVWLTRVEKGRQAVSLWKALQTWTWRRDVGDQVETHHELRYSFDAIDKLVTSLAADENAWLGYFDECGVAPLVVVYEQFAPRYETAAREIVELLGISGINDVRLPPPRMTRQADELSEEWFARYSAEKARRTDSARTEPS
jgi:LPS sulfotransferase NodH